MATAKSKAEAKWQEHGKDFAGKVPGIPGVPGVDATGVLGAVAKAADSRGQGQPRQTTGAQRD